MNKKSLIFLSYAIVALSVLIFFLVISQNNFKELFNSDLLYGHSLFRDIFIDRYNISRWATPPANYLFPDLTLLFPLILVFGNTLATIISGIIQALAMTLLINKLLKRLDVNKDIFVNTIFVIIFLLSAFSNALYPIFFNLLVPTVHTGEFLLMLISLILFLDISKKFSRRKLILLIIVVFLAIVSDLLFVITFIIPITLTIFVFRKEFSIRISRKLLILSIIITGIGGAVLLLTKFSLLAKLNQSSFTSKALRVVEIFFHDLLTAPPTLLCFTLGLIGLLGGYYIYKSTKDKTERIYSNFSIILIISLSVIPLSLGYYHDIGNLRYFFPVAIFGIINCIIIVNKFWNLNLERVLKVGISLTLVVICLSLNIKRSIYDIQNYQPEYVKCIDNIAHEKNLNYGIGSYWFAKQTTNFSREGVRVNQINDSNLTYMHWIDNKNWLKNNGDEDIKYDFILSGNLNINALEMVYGKADQLINCGETDLLIYNNKVQIKQ